MRGLGYNDNIRYGELTATRIIFCDGWRAVQNPLFPWLPYKPVKGELLEIETESTFDMIVNRGVFLLPRHDGRTVVGSTYESGDLTPSISEKGRKYLEGKLAELINSPFEIKQHVAGIRPSTRDRRPFVGIHPEIETVGILNGLGTKGVSLAPHFADELISFIEEDGEIDREANVQRYY